VTGEVCVRGPAVIGRYEQHRGTDSFQDGWFRTGDLGYFDKEGYLFLVGRSKDVIIRGGENIFPVRIESVILQYPGVSEVAVVGKPDPLYGEAVVAFVAAAVAFNQAHLRRHLAQSLPAAQCPAEIRVMSTLPKTRSNKVDKVALREAARRDT
jgi:acyl-CoA synthetase (AMP-forming)/AMP-acid ligase II